MIDTIRFKIPINENLVSDLKKTGEEVIKYNHETKTVKYRIYKQCIQLGSYNSDVSIFIDFSDSLFIEFSLPKYVLSHNVYLLYDYKKAIEKFYFDISMNISQSFPPPESWVIQRLDICYAWKFKNEEEAFFVLNRIKDLDFERKKKYIHDTSVMYKGSAYTVKFYMKQPEYFKHDFKKLIFRGQEDLAHHVFDVARGVLRYEVTIKKDGLKNYFNKEINYRQLNDDWIFDRLNYYLDKLLKIMGTSPYYENKHKLITKYGYTRAGQLLLFLNFYESMGRNELNNFFDRSTIYRNLKLLKEANVGLKVNSTDIKIRIPSIYVVNSDGRGASGV